MGLDGVHVAGLQSGGRQGLADDALLGRAVRRGQAVGGTVLVDRAAPDHRQHLVAVALGVREPLQDEEADALAPARTVGAAREGFAAAVGGQAALAAELDEGARGRHDRHPSG